MFRIYDVRKLGKNEYEVSFRLYHPLYWLYQLAYFLGFEPHIAIDMPDIDEPDKDTINYYIAYHFGEYKNDYNFGEYKHPRILIIDTNRDKLTDDIETKFPDGYWQNNNWYELIDVDENIGTRDIFVKQFEKEL